MAVFIGDLVIGGAAFVAGWYFAPYVQAAVDWVKMAYSKLRAHL